jgi:phage protein D
MATGPAALASSAPVLLVDGVRQPDLARDLLRLEVSEDTQGMKRLAARFQAWGRRPGADVEGELHLDGSVIDFGKRIEVSIGPAASARTVFSGVVSAIEADYDEGQLPQMQLLAEDALMKLRFKHRCKTWLDVSDADIARTIASEHGLQGEAVTDGPTHKVVQQWNQSDLAFLRERARLLQAEIWIDGSTLHFATRDQRPAAEIRLVNGSQLLRLRARADLAQQRSEVHVGGYDVAGREAIDESAAADAVQAESGGGRLGVQLLGQALAEYPAHRLREVPLDGSTARAWARAEMLRRARGFVRVQGVTPGTPEMVVGSSLNLVGVAAAFAGGRYRVTRLTHTYDLDQGHRTAFDAERPHLEIGP